jgi:hypothetical protein
VAIQDLCSCVIRAAAIAVARRKLYCMRQIYVFLAHVKNRLDANVFLAYKVIAFSLRDRL